MFMFNVVLTVHRDTSVQYEPTGCAIYFQYISIINFYMFQASLLPIIRRHYSVYKTVVIYIYIYIYILRFADRASQYIYLSN